MLQKIKNIFFHLPKSIVSNFIYAFPSKKLTLIGVTGTDGKTTTAILIYQILKKAGLKTGVITTIGAEFANNQKIETGLHMTSPDSLVTQKIFKQMSKAGITHVVCEVTAHALDQYRFNGCKFEVSLLTNISPEHLDYFSDFNHYLRTKSKIFNQSKTAILNKDDPNYSLIKKRINIPFDTFSLKQSATYQAKDIKVTSNSLQFKVKNLLFQTNSPYRYQVYNILAALAIIKRLNIDLKFLFETIKNFPKTKGRREQVPNNINIKTIVDFAHTPAALENTLSSLKKNNSGKLIVIFGATGGRDKSKRPKMGKSVANFANIALITADDTRNEEIENINKQIIAGIPNQNSQFFDYRQLNNKKIKEITKKSLTKFIYFNIPNRQDAFNLALKLAQTGDIVIACGKGHEKTILHGKTEYPWSETEAFRTAFNLKNDKF